MPAPTAPVWLTPAEGSTHDASVSLSWEESTIPVSNQSPSVTLDAPASQASVTEGTSLLLALTASDTDGTIASAHFNVNGGANVAATYNSGTSRWEATITAPAAGTHSFTGTAVDNGGASTTTGARTFTTTAAQSGTPLVTAWADNFNDNSIDTAKYGYYGESTQYPAETNQRLEISTGAGYVGITTKTAVDLRDKQATLEIIQVPTGTTALLSFCISGILPTGSNVKRMEWVYYNGIWEVNRYNSGGAVTKFVTTLTHVAADHQFVGFVFDHANSQILCRTRNTGGVWTTRGTITYADLDWEADLANAYLALFAGHWVNTGGFSVVDNLCTVGG